MTFRQRLALSVAATFLAAVFAGALVVSVPAQPTVSLPFATLTNVGTATAVQIVGANPSRRALTICGAATTNALTIVPVATPPITPVILTTGITIVGTATSSGCFSTQLVQNQGTSGGVGAAWNAISQTGAQNVTVLEY